VLDKTPSVSLISNELQKNSNNEDGILVPESSMLLP